MPTPPDARRYAPATDRNRSPILAVLQRVLPPTGTVLEISSGTGEHAVFFAPHLTDLRPQPRGAPQHRRLASGRPRREPPWPPGARCRCPALAHGAEAQGLGLAETVAMPANNLSVVFRAIG